MKDFHPISMANLDAKSGWLLNEQDIVESVKKIEATGIPLGHAFKIRNGIATLSNDIYIFHPDSETADTYRFYLHGQRFEVEKAICREIIKPNVLKFESEIDKVQQKLIFPYLMDKGVLEIMEEKYLKRTYPKAYRYLSMQKASLAARDKGNGEYKAWYAYGRNQALCDSGFKLMFPYMGKKPHFVFTDKRDMLIYCGYAIYHDSPHELKVLKAILESDLFHFYMTHTSKPYASGYYSYAKNYVKNFGICQLTDKEKLYLTAPRSKREINQFLLKKYQVRIAPAQSLE
jgi:adenine-specific DNA-methyltransferase